MDLAPLLIIGRSMERYLLFLFDRLLHAIPAISYVDLPIFLLLLLWRPLVT
jgi:hypothetical protein